MRRRALTLVLLLLAAGCAAGRQAPGDAAARAPATAIPPVDVDALIRRGCAACLEAAFDAASAAGAREAAFEAAALLVARAKELGLPPDRWLAEARAHVPEGLDWAMYLDIVTAQQRDPMSADRDVLMDENMAQRRTSEEYAQWRQALTSGPGSPLFRAYLDLTIACRQDAGRGAADLRDAAAADVLALFGTGVPLLLYRVGLCGGDHAGQLEAARQAEPDLVDADLELGRRDVERRPYPDVERGLARLARARAAFPESPVVPMAVGTFYEVREQWTEALAEFDATLALVPTHRDALLGRTIALSRLDRYEEGLAGATRLIELGSWLLGQAHYWRAWNLYQLGRADEARVDADRAKKLMVNPPVFVLSGMIDWRLDRLGTAEREFEEAIAIDFGQCEAAFYLGGVRLDLRRWPESLAAYQHAQQCFDLEIVTRRQAIADLSATPNDAGANAWQIAAHEREIAEAELRRAEAAQNVAAVQKFLDPM